MKDDDEEEENTFGVQRYPCMPSLVALQQMRNRLHLAFLGRKLMKWTALATGRELRHLASELYDLYEGFGEDMRNAFILLARSRYFCQQLNHIVTEDIAKRAAVVVQQSTKQVSSVKIVQFEIIETEYPPYEHLGIEKGGQAILETKKAWLELLKRIIMMMQLRSSFLMVELANKNATKKMNVLKKIVIPRTHVTVGYILTELEELAREEFTRLKKVKEKKKKDRELKEKKCDPIPTCKKSDKNISLVGSDIIRNRDEEIKELYSSVDSIHSITKPQTFEANQLDYLKSILNGLIIYGKDLLHSGIEKININEFLNMCETTKTKIDELFEVNKQSSNKKDEDLKLKLSSLRAHLTMIIDIIQEFQPEITLSPSVENFVGMSEDIRQKLDSYLGTVSVKKQLCNKKELDEFKQIINDIKKIVKEYEKQGMLSKGVDEFIQSCDVMNSKLDIHFGIDNNIPCTKSKLKLCQSINFIDSHKAGDDNSERKLEHLKYHLHEVIDIINQIKQEIKLPFSVESFALLCHQVDEKLNINREGFAVHEEHPKNKLMELRDLITRATNITKDYKNSGLLLANVDEFLETCDDMKLKLDICTQSCTNMENTTFLPKDIVLTDLKRDTELQHLIQHIDDTISLGIEAMAEGVLGESVEDFIKAFEEIKDKIESENKPQHKVMLDLESNVDEVMSMIKKLKEDGVISINIEDFLKVCEETKYKIHSNERKSPSISEKVSRLECVESCINKDSETVLIEEISNQSEFDEKPICDTCSNTFVFKKPSNETLCTTHSNSITKQQELTSTSLPDQSSSCNLCKLIAKQNQRQKKNTRVLEKENLTEQSSACELCKRNAKKGEKDNSGTESRISSERVSRTSLERENIISPKIVSSRFDNEEANNEVKENLGYFEMRKHKKVRVTTRQNEDGTVWEEKETITVNKIKRDPTITSLHSDNDNTSNEDDGSAKHVNLCILPNCNSSGFSRFVTSTQSEVEVKTPRILEPLLRQCISLDNVFYL